MEQSSNDDGLYEQRLRSLRKSISILIEWVIFTAFFFVTIYLTSLSSREGSSGWIRDLVQLLSIAVSFFFLFMLYNTVVAVKDLRFIAWTDFKLRCLMRLEVFPDSGGTLRDRVMGKLREIYPVIATFPDSKGVRFNVKASRWVKARWDIVVDLKALERLDTANLVLVKFMGPGEVGLSDLHLLGHTVRRIRILKPLTDLEAVLVVSESGFSQEAINAVEWGNVPGLPHLGTRLILAKEIGFKLES
jgi:hypothetical protein